MTPAAAVAAVFVVDVSRFSRSMMSAWLRAGHKIAAVVTIAPNRPRKRSGPALLARRVAGLFSFRQRLRRSGVAFIEVGQDPDWHRMVVALAPIRADVLICFAFPKKIPEAVLALFPAGGVNLHPALLPYYRGAQPIHRMLLDDSYRTQGGVTLHRMNATFDAGDLLAQVRFAEEDWHSLGAFGAAFACALERLAVEAVPLVVAGAVKGSPQPAGDFPRASLLREPLLVSGEWTSAYLGRLCRFLGCQPGIAVEVKGRRVRLTEPLKITGPARGAPPIVGRRHVSFDVADGRVSCRIRTGSARRLARLRSRLGQPWLKPGKLTLVYCGRS